jgi:beta-phosphoglucomutase family hydrolase
MFESMIFDMDGVIIDSEPIHYEINKVIFKDLQITLDDEEYRKFIGVTNTYMWTYLKEKYSLKHTLEELLENHYIKNLEYLKTCEDKPIPGITKLLEGLKKEGITIALASSSPMEFIETILKLFNIRNYFKVVISGENIRRSKPEPDIFLAAAEALGTLPENCVVLEDAMHGVRAAKAAAMKCIGYQNPNSWDQNLSEADMVIDNLEDLSQDQIRGLFIK